MHVRPMTEVAGAHVDEAERLEVRDPRLPLCVPLRRREPQEELRAVGDQLGALDACGERHLLRQATAAREPAALKALADARDAEEPVRRGEELLRTVGDVFAMVTSEQDR